MRSVVKCYQGSDVRVFKLDQAGVIEALKARAARLIEEHPDVVSVRLFGSLARGSARPGSDADLVVVVRGRLGPFPVRGAAWAGAFSGVGVGCDILVYSEEEWREMGEGGGRFRAVVDREGIVLAER